MHTLIRQCGLPDYDSVPRPTTRQESLARTNLDPEDAEKRLYAGIIVSIVPLSGIFVKSAIEV